MNRGEFADSDSDSDSDGDTDSDSDSQLPAPVDGITALLRHFTAPPHAELQRVALVGFDLTAEQVLSLAPLPRLRYLDASEQGAAPEVDWASSAVARRLFTTDAMDNEWDRRESITESERENCEDAVAESPPPLSPHQREEMRQRVLAKVHLVYHGGGNVLDSRRQVPPETVRAVFFAELRSEMAEPAP